MGKPMDTGNAIAALFGSIDEDVKKQVEDRLGKEIDGIKTLIEKYGVLEVKVGDKTTKLEGLKHIQLPQLLQISAQRIPTLMVGMAGTGKTHAAEQVAEALALPFYAISVGAQTSKSDILGYMHANGGYVRSMFREAYENGGVFLMDEIDAGNANVLIQVNSALSNKYCAFPDGMVKRHDDFIFIASANTFGNGANRMYVGRNQLDAATLDRFAVLEWFIDTDLETQLATDDDNGLRWLQVVKEVRKYVTDNQMRALVTPRATLRGSALLQADVPIHEVLDVCLMASLPADKQSQIKDIAMQAWSKTPKRSKAAARKSLRVSKSGAVEGEVIEADDEDIETKIAREAQEFDKNAVPF